MLDNMITGHKLFMLEQIKHILKYVEEHPNLDKDMAKLEWIFKYAKKFRENWDSNINNLSKNIYKEDEND